MTKKHLVAYPNSDDLSVCPAGHVIRNFTAHFKLYIHTYKYHFCFATFSRETFLGTSVSFPGTLPKWSYYKNLLLEEQVLSSNKQVLIEKGG